MRRSRRSDATTVWNVAARLTTEGAAALVNIQRHEGGSQSEVINRALVAYAKRRPKKLDKSLSRNDNPPQLTEP
ncbi:hypothetical protein UFOVP703_17 [uncultured Caudovirales phage]|uniref:Uncharacterized protein n=1 Tax=uncultured Caudovirales phage TaxID=2100421 RepID=A0A6J5NMC5_9CAUD|nr:hypothetical protein UFOVP703_17 [uncultured Caudovirales phage]